MDLSNSPFFSYIFKCIPYRDICQLFNYQRGYFITRELVQNPKPNPEPYLLAVEKLGMRPREVIAVEDTITGCTAAQAAGLKCIAISKHQTERDRLEGAADLLLESLEDVLSILSLR